MLNNNQKVQLMLTTTMNINAHGNKTHGAVETLDKPETESSNPIDPINPNPLIEPFTDPLWNS